MSPAAVYRLPSAKSLAAGGEEPFDRLSALAATIFRAPIVFIAVQQADGTWLRSVRGVDCAEHGLAFSVCAQAVGAAEGGMLVIEDAARDARFASLPFVSGEPGVRFFLGSTILADDGGKAGAICIIDTTPRPSPDAEDLESLRLLARTASAELSLITRTKVKRRQIQMLAMAESMSGVGHWRYEIEPHKIEWSDEVYRIHGVSRGSFDPSAGGILASYHPDDQPAFCEAIATAIQTGAGYEFKLRIFRPSGEERTVVAKAATECDAFGKVCAIVGVFQDVTDQDASTRRVADSEARYRLLADCATDIIATYGRDGIITYISLAVESVLGYKPAELIGQSVNTIIHPDDVEATWAEFRQYAQADADLDSPRVRYRALQKSGQMVWLEASPRARRDATGHVVGFQDAVRNVTATVRMEQDLKEAKVRAEAATQAKADFLSNMSHELRTPLTSVVGFSSLLTGSANIPALEKRYVDRIAQASEALLSVVNDILDYSKLEAGGVDLSVRAFDLRALLQGAGDLVEAQCDAKNLELVVTTPEAAQLMGDDARLRQVVLNFLSNAIKFTDKGRIQLSGSIQPRGDDTGILRVEVKDSGIGVAPDRLDALFERFVQADTSTTRTYGGTGLGLSISRQLIEMMGGRIGATSTVGSGSIFWFEVALPLALSKDVGHSIGTVPSPTWGRVLCADDVSANRELVSAILTSMGFEVETVADGAEAVEAVATGRFDLALIDVNMPNVDGLTATRQIRQLPGLSASIPIIALTADTQPQNVARCVAAGMDDHLDKPINLARLAQTLATWLDPEAVTRIRSSRAKAVKSSRAS